MVFFCCRISGGQLLLFGCRSSWDLSGANSFFRTKNHEKKLRTWVQLSFKSWHFLTFYRKNESTPNNDRHITINDMTIRGYRKLERKVGSQPGKNGRKFSLKKNNHKGGAGYNSTSRREISPVTHLFSPIYRGPMSPLLKRSVGPPSLRQTEKVSSGRFTPLGKWFPVH